MRNENFLRLCGDLSSYSSGTRMVMADQQIKRGLDEGSVTIEELGNAKAVVRCKGKQKWFVITGGWGNNQQYTAMMGAACGDIAGSIYEFHNIKHKLDADQLILPTSRFTDDTVLTCAVAEGLRKGLSKLPQDWMDAPDAESILAESIKESVYRFGNRYPRAGYGGSFLRWLTSENPTPYHSWGNGSAMRVSYAGWVAASLEEAEKLGEISASITHNHPEGIKGAKVVAGSIYLLREEKTKEDIRTYVRKYYDIDFTLDEIRDKYVFDVSCQGSVPQAIVAFLEGETFADVIANAISIGGDSDTIAAIAGSMAEVIYPIPQTVRGRVIDIMDEFLLNAIVEAVDFMYRRLPD